MDEKITRLEDEIHIRKIIDHLRPYIMGDGGDIEFVEFKDGIASDTTHTSMSTSGSLVNGGIVYRMNV